RQACALGQPLAAPAEPSDAARELGVRADDRVDPRPDAPARLVAHDRLDPDDLRRRVRLGEPPRREHRRRDALPPPRRAVGRADERSAARPLRDRARGDRLMPEHHLLELVDVDKSFGGLAVISGLDLHVNEGEIGSVIGPNGAGKTTLFNLTPGVYRPDDGEILLDGKSLVGLEPHQVTNRGVARTFQTLRLFLNMSVRENVMAVQYGHTH